MAIVVKLDDVLHARRMTLTELAERVGITIVNLSILKTGKARAIRFSTLHGICEALAARCNLHRAVMPARRHSGVPARHGGGRASRSEWDTEQASITLGLEQLAWIESRS